MKNWFFALALMVFFLSSCKDTSAPTIESLTVNGTAITASGQTVNAGINEDVRIQGVVRDDEDLLQFIVFIDTTGLDDKERLYADGLSGTEAAIDFTLSGRLLDSLAQRYYFGQALPVEFTLSDQNQNTTNRVINFVIN